MCSLISTFSGVFSDRTLSYLCSFQMNQPQSTPFYIFQTICLGLHQLHKKLHVRSDFATFTLLQLISPINRITLKGRHINLSWFSWLSTSLIDRFCVERGTGKPGEKNSEQGENQQQTQPTYDTCPRPNLYHIGKRRAFSPPPKPCSPMLKLYIVFKVVLWWKSHLSYPSHFET